MKMSIFCSATLNPGYFVMMLIQDFYVKLTHFFEKKIKMIVALGKSIGHTFIICPMDAFMNRKQ